MIRDLIVACTMALGLSGAVCTAEQPVETVDWLKQVADKATGHHHESFKYGSAGKAWGGVMTRWTPSGRSYVGSDRSGESLTFRKEMVEPHHAVLMRLKLFVIYHWDGNWTVYGPDFFRVQLDRDRELLRTTFSNFGSVGQSYPDHWPWGRNPARAGAAEAGTLGWKFPGGWGEPLDAVYDIWLGAVRNSRGQLELEFRGDFHDARDPLHLRGEQWGIESLDIHTFDQAVELPDDAWEIMTKQLLSGDIPKVANAQALLPLGPSKRVLRALDMAAAAHGLDRESLARADRPGEERTAEDVMAGALEQAADALRRRDSDAEPAAEPTKSCRAARLYQVLLLMNADFSWKAGLWQEMNRTHQ